MCGCGGGGGGQGRTHGAYVILRVTRYTGAHEYSVAHWRFRSDGVSHALRHLNPACQARGGSRNSEAVPHLEQLEHHVDRVVLRVVHDFD